MSENKYFSDEPIVHVPYTPPGGYEKTDVILKVENVGLSFDDKVILRDVNLEVKDIRRTGVQQGQVIGLFGPSGMGKTKLFEIITGHLKPSTGNVLVGVEQKPVEIGQIGLVMQKYPLFRHRTVYGNLKRATRRKFGMLDEYTEIGRELLAKVRKTQTVRETLEGAAAYKFKSRHEVRERIDGLLNKFNLLDKKDLYPAQLSGGQRQRVAIAQQLLSSEHFLFLDEPFSGLDIKMVKQVSNLIRELSLMDELNTIIIVSHDIDVTCALADTVWIMGRDRDAEGNPIPGAYIKHTKDLAERGLAWQPGIEHTPAFAELMLEIENDFTLL